MLYEMKKRQVKYILVSVSEDLAKRVLLTTTNGLSNAYQRALAPTTPTYVASRVTEHKKCTKAGYVRCPW
jgi:hypothetical protein